MAGKIMRPEIKIENCEIAFLTKKQFVERKKTEYFSVEQKVEEKLDSFKDDDIIALHVSINSPAVVKDVENANDIVAFMRNKFKEEGVTEDQINASFKSLME